LPDLIGGVEGANHLGMQKPEATPDLLPFSWTLQAVTYTQREIAPDRVRNAGIQAV
jgi:hypothetical protein